MTRKRVIVIVAALVCFAAVLTMLSACVPGGQSPETPTAEAPVVSVFLNGTTVNGFDISGLTPEEAAAALADRTKGYFCKVVLGEKSYVVTGEELSVTYNETIDLQDMLDQQKADGPRLAFTAEGLYTADMTALRARLEADFPSADDGEPTLPAGEDGTAPAEDSSAAEEESGEEADARETVDPSAPKNAYLKYDETCFTYFIVPDEPRLKVDCGVVVEQVQAAVLNLEPEIIVDMDQFYQQAEITADNENLVAALEEINGCLNLQLTYTFTPDGGSTSSVTIPREMLGTLFYLDETDLSVGVDEEALRSYVDTLVNQYSVSGKSAQFKTTGGSYIDVTVNQDGQSVNSTALYNDLLKCLQGKTGGTRAAAYTEVQKGYWGGSYVEVDLTNQHLWLYKNGECILSCDIVSGCVADNTRTPTGCYAIYSKQKDCYLTGNNVDGTRYKEWVSYFMPFLRGYAIHDATWRSTFGGTEYYYNGSHGCVGTTESAAKTIYENVSIGTHVVIYGGIKASSLPTQDPDIRFSQSEYTVEVGQTIDLGITTASDGARQLVTGNDNAAAVGTGSICGVAEGDVTVSCYVAATDQYKPGSAEVVVHVVPAGFLAEEPTIAGDSDTNSDTNVE